MLKDTHKILSFYFILFSLLASAQNNGVLIENSLDIKIPFTITQFSTKSGLPQSRVVDIVSKGNGNLIILTANGICEYNGNEFTPFIKDNSYKVFYFSKLIWHEKSGQLFGVSDYGSLKLIYPKLKSLDGFVATCLNSDSLYCINANGEIYVSDVVSLNFRKRYATSIVKALCLFYNSGSFIVGTVNGLYDFNLRTNQSKELQKGSFCEIKKNPFNNAIYALAQNQAYKLHPNNIEKILDLNQFNTEVLVNDIEFTDTNDCYISTTKGLYEISRSYSDHYTKVNAFPSVYLQALHYNSKENCLFVGTGEKGMLKLQFKNCYSFTSNQGFEETISVSSIIRNASGKILVVNGKGLIYQFKIDTVVQVADLKYPCASLAKIDEEIYVGTWGKGVLVLRENQLTDSITFPAQVPDPNIHAVFKDSKGTIWIGTNRGIAKGESAEKIRPYLSTKIKNVVICFFELKNKSICIGGNEGVYILNEHHELIKHLGKTEGLVGKEVRSFYEDIKGRLWIGTYDGGLYCYFKNVLSSINQLKNCKLDMDAFSLAKDDYGYIYISSNHGLWRVSEEKLFDFYEGKLNYLIPFYYGEETGIVNTEFNGGFQNNFVRSRNNHFYFPSIEGVVLVDPEEPNFRKLSPRIDQIFVNDTIHESSNNVLNDKTFSIAFHFSCLSYLNKYNIHFQYKLQNGRKAEWSTLQKNPSVVFKMLPAGHYTFSVRAIDAFNDSNPKVVTYEFIIRPVFYDTIWFKLLVSSFIFALTIVIIRVRMSHFRSKAEEKEKVKRQLAEFELKATHAQMNPHFIFNSLNSIKYYLSINDQKNADNYIDHFSSLLRSFLENGSKDFIAVKDEIDILISYLELEKQRMNPSFSYELSAKEDLFTYLIPTHIIQPFVENAIKHGINHSDKKCNLFIHFYIKEGVFICEIDDNGIGRDRSYEINRNRSDHNSKGLEMVKEKIRIVKEIYKLEILLNIEDKFDNENKSTGTRVQINIPIPVNEDHNS